MCKMWSRPDFIKEHSTLGRRTRVQKQDKDESVRKMKLTINPGHILLFCSQDKQKYRNSANKTVCRKSERVGNKSKLNTS